MPERSPDGSPVHGPLGTGIPCPVDSGRAGSGRARSFNPGLRGPTANPDAGLIAADPGLPNTSISAPNVTSSSGLPALLLATIFAISAVLVARRRLVSETTER